MVDHLLIFALSHQTRRIYFTDFFSSSNAKLISSGLTEQSVSWKNKGVRRPHERFEVKEKKLTRYLRNVKSVQRYGIPVTHIVSYIEGFLSIKFLCLDRFL